MSQSAVLIEGDGVGPEVIGVATRVIASCGVDIAWDVQTAGLGAYQATGHTAPKSTLDAIASHGFALKGPFETPSGGNIHSANMYIRRDLDLYACVRPVTINGHELTIVRENVEDMYAAIEWWASPDVAQAVKIATRSGCRRIASVATKIAASRVDRHITIVHKANNLKLTEGMFLDEAREEACAEAGLRVDDMLADTACSTMVLDPTSFGVILANNTFGDLLSNVAAAVAGSLGLVPSANLGSDLVVTEASHGSVPELAGTGRANPVAAVRAGAMLLDYMGYSEQATWCHKAVDSTISRGTSTPDLGGTSTTSEFGDELVAAVLMQR